MRKRPDIPEKFRPFVNNYKINVFEIAYLSREQVNVFKSDFRVVADYFVQKRENGDYIPDPQELKHVQETLQLLSVMTGDHRLENAYNDNKAERSAHNMCDVLDRIENRGWQKGLLEGCQNGLREKENQVIFSLHQSNVSWDVIAASVGKTVDESPQSRKPCFRRLLLLNSPNTCH